MHRTLILLAGLLTWASPGMAQHRLSGPAPSSLFGYGRGAAGSARLAEVADSARRVRPTYWKEGAVLGGVLGLIGGAVAGNRLCGLSESTEDCTGSVLLGGVLGAALLALPGALIGGQFSKRPTEVPPET